MLKLESLKSPKPWSPAVGDLQPNCWICGKVCDGGGAITYGCEDCEVEWRSYGTQPSPTTRRVLWMGMRIDVVDFRPLKDWPKDSLFTDPRIPLTP
jgi:hypothetical protein